MAGSVQGERRVAITGAGSVNALGIGVDAFAAGLRAARCGIGPLSLFDTTGYRTACSAQVKLDTPPAWLPAATARHVSRSDLFALMAAHEALAGAGWLRHDSEAATGRVGEDAAAGVGIVVGATTGGMFGSEEHYRRSLLGLPPERHMTLLMQPVSSSADWLARAFGCLGPRLTVSTACSSGANALGIAAEWIRGGRAEVMLCGGTDALCRMTFSGFNALQALDAVPCRPFDRERAGLSLGEGAALFVLEDYDRARARGATVLAEFLGYGVSADAHHITQPRPDGTGARLAMERALQASGIEVEEVDYVNAHGTATPLNDAIETRVLKTVLGAHAYRIPVSSTKSMVGHCLGAAGAIEALACVLALRGGFVPPTLHLEHADPECDLDYVPGMTRPGKLRTVLSNSYGFGGNNTCIVMRRAD